MIYSHKPHRSGRNIQANTNFPPQDPPPPVPDVLIADSTPPIPEPCKEKAPTLTKPVKKVRKPKTKAIPKPIEKITWRTKLVLFFKKLFRRDI